MRRFIFICLIVIVPMFVWAQEQKSARLSYPKFSVSASIGSAFRTSLGTQRNYDEFIGTKYNALGLNGFVAQYYPFKHWGLMVNACLMENSNDLIGNAEIPEPSLRRFQMENGFVLSDESPSFNYSEVEILPFVGVSYRTVYRRIEFQTTLSYGMLNYKAWEVYISAKEEYSNVVRDLAIAVHDRNIGCLWPKFTVGYNRSKLVSWFASVGYMCPLNRLNVSTTLSDAYDNTMLDQRDYKLKLGPYVSIDLGITFKFGYKKL